MAFEKFQNRNLAKGQFLAGISASSTILILRAGQGDLFPDEFPFFMKLEKYDTSSSLEIKPVLKREIVKVTNRVNDTFTIVRSAGYCPANDGATTQTNTAFSFDEGDWAFQVLTTEQINDIQNEIANDDNTSNLVHKTGNETIGGNKTFTGNNIHSGNNQFTGDNEYLGENIYSDHPKQSLYTTPLQDEQYVPKKYVDDSLKLATSLPVLTNRDIICGEDIKEGDIMFPEENITINEATEIQTIGNNASTARIAFRQIGSGISDNKLRISLGKNVSPSVPLGIRIETDNNGEPSGNLIDPNAVASIPEGDILGMLEDDQHTFTSTQNQANANGYRLLAKDDIIVAKVNKSPTCTATVCQLKTDAGVLLATATFVGNVATFTSANKFNNGEYFRIEAYNNGANFIRHYVGGSYPKIGSSIDYVYGSQNGANEANANNIDSIETLSDMEISLTSAVDHNMHGETLDTTDNTRMLKGLKFQPTAQVGIVSVEKDPASDASKAYLYNEAGELLATANFLGDEATFQYGLAQDSIYYVLAGNDGNYYNNKKQSVIASYPYNLTKIDLLGGAEYLEKHTDSFNYQTTVLHTGIYNLSFTFEVNRECKLNKITVNNLIGNVVVWLGASQLEIGNGADFSGNLTLTPGNVYTATYTKSNRDYITGTVPGGYLVNVLSSYQTQNINVTATVVMEDNDDVNTILNIKTNDNIFSVEGAQYRVVMYQGTYGSETVNAVNYYKTGYANKNTTTRFAYSEGYKYEPFDGTIIDTAYWEALTGGYMSVNNALKMSLPVDTSVSEYTQYTKQLGSMSDDNITLQFSGNGDGNGYAYSNPSIGHAIGYIYRDNDNLISLDIKRECFGINGIGQYLDVRIRRAGVNVYTNSLYLGLLSATPNTVKIEFIQSTGTIKFYYLVAGVRTQIGTTQTYVYAFGNPKIMLGFYGYAIPSIGYYNGTIDDVYISKFFYPTENPAIYTQNKFHYISSSLFATRLLAKANAQYLYKLPDLPRIAIADYETGEKPYYDFEGITHIFDNLNYDIEYYLSDVPGLISAVPGTNKVKIGRGKLEDELVICQKYINIPITVGRSPFVRQNTSCKPVQFTVTGGAVNPIQISKDGVTYYTLSTATNYIGQMAPGDYLKITYSSLPVVRYSHL